MKHHTDRNTIDFESPRLKGIGEKGYTLYSKKKFALICNAMAIRRFGIKAMKLAGEYKIGRMESCQIVLLNFLWYTKKDIS